MMEANYFFIDGSALTAQVRQLQRSDAAFRAKKLSVRLFLTSLVSSLEDLITGNYKRATFYFPTGDEVAIQDYLDLPDFRKPGQVRDLHFKFCGHKLKKSAEFDKFVEENVPPKFQSRFAKSEKGIDIEICCDALRLASMSRLERLVLLTNDGDFIPLCRTLKQFGANISILHLSEATAPNVDLIREADSYDVIDTAALQTLFIPVFDDPGEASTVNNENDMPAQILEQTQSEKPDADPSDLRLVQDAEGSAPED